MTLMTRLWAELIGELTLVLLEAAWGWQSLRESKPLWFAVAMVGVVAWSVCAFFTGRQIGWIYPPHARGGGQ